ncbi:DUF4199 domain-containing protein [Telluribacter sp. SYSU D00476]|uniref:DUF4199 domain-containing protein n=1 Tax=Telluribacter sp. SYSU D00476 TaxID=2811430 RepID=UPI001FF356AB|nr:DUF4199 domain-containing protein [Telluribacter sp. SYSU D00476]
MKTEFKYAANLTGILFLWLCLEFWIGFHDALVDYLPVTSLLTVALWALVLNREIREKKNLPTTTFWNYGRGFRTAFLTTVLALPMLLLSRWLFYNLINPDFFNNIMIKGREWISVSAPSEDNFNQSVKMMEDYFQMKTYQSVTLVFNAFTGLVCSIFLPFLHRRK